MTISQTHETGASPTQLLPERGYIICCLERTGSNLLTGALSATNLAGRPFEYFNPFMQDKPPLRDLLGGARVVEELEKVLRAGTTPNGVFGAKIHWCHLRFFGMSVLGRWSENERTKMHDMLSAQLPRLLSESETNSLLDAHFAKLGALRVGFELLGSHVPDLRVIWLRRDNMVARAISHYRALRSGVWFRVATDAASLKTDPSLEFDLGAIHSFYCLGVYQQKHWRAFFRDRGIFPYEVVYEDLVANYEETVRGVLRSLDLDAEKALIRPPGSARQSDAQSKVWEQQYRDAVSMTADARS